VPGRGSVPGASIIAAVELAPGESAPRILSRPEHVISRKNIDPDALRVLYRLKNSGFIAYLVGGGVRDLLLQRQPKDFDIGTSAHPQQVRKLFRSCFIVGRRFRLAHVRFGRKVIEVSTFRRATEPEEGEVLIRRDNTFGTPEEDAFRRDFTVNALFYDIANFSVIDWVGGLADLEARLIRTIGDPAVRFREDPVRMLRAVALAARLGFTIDAETREAIRALRGEIVRSSSARILEELYKILRQGRSRETLESLHEYGLLAYLLPEADRALADGGETLLGSLSRLDEHRRAGATPDQLTNPLLMGSLLVPLGVPLRRVSVAPSHPRPAHPRKGAEAVPPRDDLAAEARLLGVVEEEAEPPGGAEEPKIALPFARRDLERLRLLLLAQRRLREPHPAAAARRLLSARHYFDESVRWLEIHGGAEGHTLAEEWRSHAGAEPGAEPDAGPAAPESAAAPAPGAGRRRRRRRRRRSRSTRASA
jgi:tRNA nucleotidyltransferase/poly(A) polymerase